MGIYADLINECRERFAGRHGGWWRRLFPQRPQCDPRDDIKPALRPAYARLMREGRVVWSCVVQANYSIWQPGDNDSGYHGVYDVAGALDDRPWVLADVAGALGAMKDTHPADPELRAAAYRLTDELDHCPRHPVPAALTGGIAVNLGAILLHRRRLPGRRLQGKLLPVVIAPGRSDFAMVPPLGAWPAELARRWEELCTALDDGSHATPAQDLVRSLDSGPARPVQWDDSVQAVRLTREAEEALRDAQAEVDDGSPIRLVVRSHYNPDADFRWHTALVVTGDALQDDLVRVPCSAWRVEALRDEADHVRGVTVDWRCSFGEWDFFCSPKERTWR